MPLDCLQGVGCVSPTVAAVDAQLRAATNWTRAGAHAGPTVGLDAAKWTGVTNWTKVCRTSLAHLPYPCVGPFPGVRPPTLVHASAPVPVPCPPQETIGRASLGP